MTFTSNPFQTMYLGTIESSKQDVSFRRRTREEYDKMHASKDLNLKTGDIDGAQASTTFESKLQTREHQNRPTFHDSSDIQGTQPDVLIPRHVNRINHNLKIDDIDGARQLKNRLCITRQVNPLNPVYKLPSFKVRPITPPKFIRDSIRVDDIEGAKAKYPTKQFDPNYQPEDKMRKYECVIDRRSGYGLPPRKDSPTDNSLRAKDINNDGIFKSRRVTNPLSPRYEYNQDGVASESIGSLDGMNRPRKLPTLRKDRPLFSLRTDDIPNMRIPGTHQQYLSKSFPIHRRQYHKTNYTKDIQGAFPRYIRNIITMFGGNNSRTNYTFQSSHYSTFFKKSKRQTDPLNPQYKPFWDVGAHKLPGMSAVSK